MARTAHLPFTTALLVGLPVFWAYPEGLSAWRSVAIVTGWVCCGLLLACLLFIIREPWLAKHLGGLERMYTWHHWIGFAAYVVILGHPLALALDAWDEHPSLAWSVLSPWEQSWPGWLGWVSLLCLMVGMWITLASCIRYSTWRWLHIFLAVAVILAVGHLILLGLDYMLLWTPLLAMCFMAWRVIRSDCGTAAKPFVVTRVSKPAQDIVEVVLKPLLHPIVAKPGQFLLASFGDGPHFHGCREFHPFTISALSPSGELSLGIKALGDCTNHLQSVECGVATRLQGPFGSFLANQSTRPGLWVAGGIGITPFLAVLRAGPLKYPVQLLYLYRTEEDAAYLDELHAFAQHDTNFKFTAKNSGPYAPELSDILPTAAELRELDCYLCGPPGLVTATVSFLRKQGVPAERMFFERFDFR